MATVVKTTFKLRRGLASEWSKVNPILAAGEPGWALDTYELKVGDGVKAWNDLPQASESLLSNYVKFEDLKNLQTQPQQNYEIASVPKGTLINQNEHEIRVMCPYNADWRLEGADPSVGANTYYMSFKAYAPENACFFREGLEGFVDGELSDFNGDFAGTDEQGRKYSICWLPLASYAEGDWNYYGKNSTFAKYVGWSYIVEWYNENQELIAFNGIRINLSNENCHYNLEPYYMGSIDASRLIQKENEYLVLYGGSASEVI